MPSTNAISADKLLRLLGTPLCPALIDVRGDDDYGTGHRLIPGSVRRPHVDTASWAGEFAGRTAIVICGDGGRFGHGVAAWLRHAGIPAEVLEDGFAGWVEAGLPLLNAEKMPPRDREGRTVWVTRSRPKVDRIACAWLIRRFVDPRAVFLFLTAAEVAGVAEQFAAAPFDIEDVFWGHRGATCTFDVMVQEFGLTTEPLLRLATIVRGADTGRMDLAPQAAGLVAASLGLSRMYADDLAQLEAGMGLYDAFYRWCRDATEELHGDRSRKP
jgi:rhodanese-related sulfurtransferase